MKMFDAPVAGANYAADTRNYPWHRPPEITEYDEGTDYLITKLKEPETHELVFSLLEIETSVSTVVSTLMMQGISRGKFPIDLAILMAGPVARYISIIADSQNIKYDMGVGDEDRIRITPTALKVALGIIDDEAPEDEQAAMLGLTADEEEAPVEEDDIEQETA